MDRMTSGKFRRRIGSGGFVRLRVIADSIGASWLVRLVHRR
jgi:hypothetical protein